MVTTEQINRYLHNIPASTKQVTTALAALETGDVRAAAESLKTELPVIAYFRHVVASPVYGFRETPSDIGQILALLGPRQSASLLAAYQASLLAPKRWMVFDLSTPKFLDFNAWLGKGWETILAARAPQKLGSLMPAAALMTCAVAVADALLGEYGDDVARLRQAVAFDMNRALTKLTGISLFDLAARIARSWGFSDELAELVAAAGDADVGRGGELAAWLHLLLFYASSRPLFVDSGLNGFVTLNTEGTAPYIDDFMALMGIE